MVLPGLSGVTMNQYLRSVQAVSENDDINGGIYGSYPYDAPNGGYRPNDIPSWAAKFFADAMMYEIAYGA